MTVINVGLTEPSKNHPLDVLDGSVNDLSLPEINKLLDELQVSLNTMDTDDDGTDKVEEIARNEEIEELPIDLRVESQTEAEWVDVELAAKQDFYAKLEEHRRLFEVKIFLHQALLRIIGSPVSDRLLRFLDSSGRRKSFNREDLFLRDFSKTTETHDLLRYAIAYYKLAGLKITGKGYFGNVPQVKSSITKLNNKGSDLIKRMASELSGLSGT